MCTTYVNVQNMKPVQRTGFIFCSFPTIVTVYHIHFKDRSPGSLTGGVVIYIKDMKI